MSELPALYPDAPAELLEYASRCPRLEDAIDAVINGLVAGGPTPQLEQNPLGSVTAQLQERAAPVFMPQLSAAKLTRADRSESKKLLNMTKVSSRESRTSTKEAKSRSIRKSSTKEKKTSK